MAHSNRTRVITQSETAGNWASLTIFVLIAVGLVNRYLS